MNNCYSELPQPEQNSNLPVQLEFEEPMCVCGATVIFRRFILARDPVSLETFKYVTCTKCGTQRISPRPVRVAISHYYPPLYYAHVSSESQEVSLATWLKRLLYYVFFATAREKPRILYPLWLLLYPILFPLRYRTQVCFVPPKIRRVFEFGAGRGSDLCEFRKMGWEVTGCEPSPRGCEAAKANGILLQCAAAEDAYLPESHFSCILMNNVIEHIHDPSLVLKKSYNSLIPDGVLVLILPNHSSISSRLFGASWPGYDAPRHLWGFTVNSIRHILHMSGFEIEVIRHQAPTRWCWEAVLDGRGSPVPVGEIRKYLATKLPWLLLPLGIAFSLIGQGDFIRVIARKKELI